MNISINKHNQELIKQMIKSGDFSSPDEVVNAALQILEDNRHKLSTLRVDIQEGFDSGPSLPGEQVM